MTYNGVRCMRLAVVKCSFIAGIEMYIFDRTPAASDTLRVDFEARLAPHGYTRRELPSIVCISKNISVREKKRLPPNTRTHTQLCDAQFPLRRVIRLQPGERSFFSPGFSRIRGDRVAYTYKCISRNVIFPTAAVTFAIVAVSFF